MFRHHSRLLLLAVVAMTALSFSCKTKSPSAVVTDPSGGAFVEAVVLFYNTENLFDTLNDPTTNDDDFTPAGKLMWNTERYRTKLDRIREVMSLADAGLPAITGLCEVENRAVLADLVRTLPGGEDRWRIVHRDSPDERGIDVAMIFDKTRFTVIREGWLTVRLSDPEDPDTRDILHVSGVLDGEHLHVFVNHWPSRSGGQAESEPDRIRAAEVLRTAIMDIRKEEGDNARILCMGDLNDHPSDKSVREVLGAGTDPFLVNLMADEEALHEGSHWYKGEWGALDQFIVSAPLMRSGSGKSAVEGKEVLSNERLLFTDNQGNARPNRTYAGDSYKAGYSDHLPIVLRLAHR